MLRLSAHGDIMAHDTYVRDLSDSLDLDLWAAGELAGHMVAAGLVTLTQGTVRLTDAGADLRMRLRQAVGDVTAPLYAPLDPADVKTTVSTLRGITERAWALRSHGAGGWS